MTAGFPAPGGSSLMHLSLQDPASIKSAGCYKATTVCRTDWVCRVTVTLTGILLIWLVLTAPPLEQIDDLGLYNPIHMLLTTGHLTYPIYHQPEGMTVHPPIRYFEIALLMKMGFGQYARHVVPALLSTLATVVLIFLRWPAFVKYAACFAAISTYSLVFSDGMSLRPDPDLVIAWIAGLLLLELGRQNSFNRWGIFFGGALITYAAALHYPATLALLGIGVYILSAWYEFGYKQAIRTFMLGSLGAGIVLIPYLGVYVPLNWKLYDFVFSVANEAFGKFDGVIKQFSVYDELTGLSNQVGIVIPAAILSALRTIPIPLFIIPIVGFVAWKRMWVFGFAALPLLLFVLVQSRKVVIYLVPEYFFIMFGSALLVLAIARKLLAILPRAFESFSANLVNVAIAGFLLYLGYTCSAQFITPRLTAMATNWVDGFALESDLARATSKAIVGDNSTIGGRLGLWYVSGAYRWYDISSDVLWRDNTQLDLQRYLSNFDYIVEHDFMTDSVINTPRENVTTWYVKGILKLKGFYIGSNSVAIQTLNHFRFSTDPDKVFAGFVHRDRKLFRFDQKQDGLAAAVTAVCYEDSEEIGEARAKLSVTTLPFPTEPDTETNPKAKRKRLILAVAEQAEPVVQLLRTGSQCQQLQVVRGTLSAFTPTAIMPLAAIEKNRMDFDLMRTSVRDVFHFSSRPGEGGIVVQQATYGRSCIGVVPPSYKLRDGNATAVVARMCNGWERCDVHLWPSWLGDPAPLCAKNFGIDWVCPSGQKGHITLGAEAAGQTLHLSCPPSQ
jgi:hypothetical protein